MFHVCSLSVVYASARLCLCVNNGCSESNAVTITFIQDEPNRVLMGREGRIFAHKKLYLKISESTGYLLRCYDSTSIYRFSNQLPL